MLDDTSHAWLHAAINGDTAETSRLGRVLDTATMLDQARPVSLADAARDLATTGVAVFPVTPRGKQPLTRHGFKDATLNLEQITAWWAATPDANIGIPTGITFDVVDIDGQEGIASLYNGPDPAVDSLTILAVALTSRPGGRHLYVPPSGHGNKAAIYPGVDYRGTGGYVVAPPSTGANSVRYRWMLPLPPVLEAVS